MNRIIILLMAVALFSCSSKNSYEKAIADFVQTDKKGTFYDMKFKALEIKELQRITVADSIAIFDNDSVRNKQIQVLQDSIKYLAHQQACSDILLNGEIPCEKEIQKLRKELEAFKMHTTIYESRAADELLTIVVQCKYSLVPPTMNTTITETKDFVLTPDGKKCLSSSKAQ